MNRRPCFYGTKAPKSTPYIPSFRLGLLAAAALLLNSALALAVPSSSGSCSGSGSGTMPSSVSSEQASSSTITVLGLGSLLSERSSRTTFPNLRNFRLGRVEGYRRVFGHPASIFFRRGLANLDTEEYSSLSAEPVDNADGGGDNNNDDDGRRRNAAGFVCSVFEVPRDEIMTTAAAATTKNDGGDSSSENRDIPSRAFLEREEEFNIIQVPYIELDPTFVASQGSDSRSDKNIGVLCTRSTDEAYVQRWCEDRFDKHYKQFGIDTIWNFSEDSNLKPCQVYLRHCYLAAEKLGPECFNSFLDETFLVDRTTTIRQYVSENPRVLETLPPP